MPTTLGGVDSDGLERSCERIRFGPAAPGLERAEVFLRTSRFVLHRHDTYAIGITLRGVQTFRYRGARRIGVAGQAHVLHPDELHDGAAATPDGFGYRIVYVAPELMRDALGGRSLPFVADPVVRATAPLVAALADIEEPLDGLAASELVAGLADMLLALGGRPGRVATLDLRAVERVREHLAAHADQRTGAETLEAIAGTDRYTIARHFRRAFGTSPDRYRTLRRLELARVAIQRGEPLARAAADAGFADQSHLTRHFKRTYGLTPARWQALTTPALPTDSARPIRGRGSRRSRCRPTRP